MIKNKITVLLFALALLTGCNSANQNASSPVLAATTSIEDITAMPQRAASIYHCYEFRDVDETPAPKGYKPFYINYYGRHGSRYHVDMTFVDPCYSEIVKAREAGILTAEGLEIASKVEAVVDATQDMWGMLTPRGFREQKMLAKRMYERYPELLSSGKVRARATDSKRCIESMGAYCTSLAACAPNLEFDMDAGVRYRDGYLSVIGSGFKAYNREARKKMYKYRSSQSDYTRLNNAIFSDPGRIGEVVADIDEFYRTLFLIGAICESMDFLGVDIFSHYTIDELVAEFRYYNNRMYGIHCNSVEYGHLRTPDAGNLVQDFIDKAADAIDGEGVVFDARFGHDTAMMAFESLMGIEGFDAHVPFLQVNDAFKSYYVIPLAGNLTFVYYCNSAGDILFKVLRNEEEVHITSLVTDTYPYYRWSDFVEKFSR